MNASPEAYQTFFEEYLLEAEEEVIKSAVYKKTFILRDKFIIPYISPVLEKKSKRDIIFQFTSKFMDDHSAQLSASGPIDSFTFGKKEATALYELFGIDSALILNIFQDIQKETYYGKLSKPYHGLINEVPHKLLLVALMVESLQKEYNEVLESAKYLYAFTEYPIIYRKFWPIGVKADVMEYTIEHLPSSKFKSRKTSNVGGLLKYDMDSTVDKHSNRLKTGYDHEYLDLIMRIRNTIKNTFLNISTQYYKNFKGDHTQYKQSGKRDDGSLADVEGTTSTMASAIENTYNKISVNPINIKIISLVSEGNQVDPGNVKSFLNQIFTSKNNKLYRMIENTITAYLSKNPTNTSIGSGEFMNFGIALFRSIATSKNQTYIEIRQILNMWMYDIVNIERYYKNAGTISNYTRAIFNYIIFLIHSYN